MPTWERGLRVAGGIFGARQTINTEIAAPTSITNKTVDKLDDIFKNNPTFKPQSEAVTPEGLRVRIPTGKMPLEKLNEPLEISISADDANAPHLDIGRKAPYGGTRARDIVVQKETRFVRVHGEDNQTRSWLMRAEDVEGLTASQIKEKFALPELPKYISDVYVPKGIKLFVGKVAAQPGWGKGGGIQYEIKDVWLPKTAYKNRRILP